MFNVNNINVNLEKLQWCGSSPSLPIFIIIVIMYYVLLFQYLYYIIYTHMYIYYLLVTHSIYTYMHTMQMSQYMPSY